MKQKLYDSMASASGASGISVDLLKRAKRAGCPMFKGSRVNINGLQKWISDNQDKIKSATESDTLKEQKLSEEVRKLKLANDIKERLLVQKFEVASAIRRALAQVATLSESKLVNEYPTAVAGLDCPQARVYGKRLHDALMEECQKLAKEFPE